MPARSYALFSAQYPPHLGGVENFTQSLAGALAARGHAVTVVTNDTEGLGAGVVREGGVEVVRLPCVPLVSGRLPLARPLAGRGRLLRELAGRRFDGVLVNARFYPHSLLGMRLARRRGLRPVVLDHGSAYLSFSSPVLDPLVRAYEDGITAWGRRRGAAYYGISGASVGWLRHFGIEAEGVIPNAIDAEGYRAQASGRDFRGELGLDADSPLVAFVGRLIPEKGVRALIEASRAPALARAGVTFVLAGDGPLAEEVRAACGERLRWVGRLDRADTAALLSRADLLCLPTRSEGFSTTLLEAAACGCPAVVTDVGGAREVTGEGTCGVLLASADAGEVARAAAELVGDRARLAQMSACCRARARTFSWDATAEAVERALGRE